MIDGLPPDASTGIITLSQSSEWTSSSPLNLQSLLRLRHILLALADKDLGPYIPKIESFRVVPISIIARNRQASQPKVPRYGTEPSICKSGENVERHRIVAVKEVVALVLWVFGDKRLGEEAWEREVAEVELADADQCREYGVVYLRWFVVPSV